MKLGTTSPLTNSTVAQLLAWAETALAAHTIATPRLDAEVLLAHSLRTNRAGLYTRLHTVLSSVQSEMFQQLLDRRLQHEPVPYITGVQEFWSLEFAVDRRVLIPRPETEGVVETVLQVLNLDEGQYFSPHPNPLPKGAREFYGKILDIGTGSGCLAIALATELPNAEIWAIDISAPALAVATGNARRHHVHQRIHFLQGDVFAPFSGQEQNFEVIIANPPYIPTTNILTLQPEVRNWEPRQALDGGEDGLDFYRVLLGEASQYLSPNGWLIMEIGAGQEAAVLSGLTGHPEFSHGSCTPDYAGHGRVIAGQRKPSSSFSQRR